MLIIPDERLFRHQYNGDASGEEFAGKVRDAQRAATADADSLTVLNAEIARIAGDINRRLVPRGPRDFRRRVAMADYLAKQKAAVPIPLGYLMRASTGPINKWSVEKALREWGFDPSRIQTTIKKYKRFPKGGCYVKVTFRKK